MGNNFVEMLKNNGRTHCKVVAVYFWPQGFKE